MIFKILVHMFYKAKCLNHQLVQFKIKITLVNRNAKVLQKNKKQYDVRTEYCTLQKFGTEIDLPSN